MAPRSSKNSKAASSRKRTGSANKNSARSAKPRPKSKKRTLKKKKSTAKIRVILSLGIFLMVSLIAFGYYLGQNGKSTFSQTTVHSTSSQKVHYRKNTSGVFSKVKAKRPPVKKTAAGPKKEKQQGMAQSKNKAALAYRTKKPKLVIIIDDVSNAKQLKHIRALGFPVTPSIFPPSKLSMQSYKLARGLQHYMIHLPMESGSKQFNTQLKTLKISFSKKQMEKRIKEIRSLFPTARYINNHTGSVFTGDYKAMHTLYGLMKKEGFLFIDSRTTASSKVRKIAHEYGDAYVARDIFMDNIQTVPSIHQQLKKAVKIAKKKGYAIAIGHPHKATMRALASAGNLFKDVELVYIDQIYKNP